MITQYWHWQPTLNNNIRFLIPNETHTHTHTHTSQPRRHCNNNKNIEGRIEDFCNPPSPFLSISVQMSLLPLLPDFLSARFIDLTGFVDRIYLFYFILLFIFFGEVARIFTTGASTSIYSAKCPPRPSTTIPSASCRGMQACSLSPLGRR